ncbi:malto-oligosyltrehalose synthase [Angustibacter speluncae]
MSEPHRWPSHRPAAGRPVPVSTYRLQVNADQTFADVARAAPYLASLGVTHAYLSPVLAAAPGSTHGYDVLDHSRLSPEAGGREAFDAMVSALREHGLGVVADVVPNHMVVPVPVRLNSQLWSVLREGPHSPFASWFDIDWGATRLTSLQVEPGDEGVRSILMPVLGARIGQVLAEGDLVLDATGDEPVLRYHEHEFPVRPGTEHLPLAELVDRQWYRLAHWKVGDSELNYRRFFDVGTLAAVRVEDPDVFEATHRLLVDLVADGSLDGLRIDHPDGLADPRQYLRRLAEATGGSWVVVEKILEGEEPLPDDWPCAGTTGYDALLRVGGLFVHPSAAGALQATWSQFAGDDPDLLRDMHHVVELAKHEVVRGGLYAEVHRLVELLVGITSADIRLRDHTRRGLEAVVTALLVAFDRYRAYVVPGEQAPPAQVEVVRHAADLARERLPDDLHETLDLVVDLVLGHEAGSAGRSGDADRAELVVRFQQTCGPVMAKGIEDTAYYRSFRLLALNEVGGDPDRFGVSPEQVHAWAERQLTHWPTAMTTLSTHDTKRAEDARARLAVLSEVPGLWDESVRAWHAASADVRSPLLDGPTEYLVWQTLIATWDHVADEPISSERLLTYLTKAVREAKVRTTWTAVDEPYEQAVAAFATGVLGSADLVDGVRAFVAATADLVRVGVLGQKLVQLTTAGVPDVYQGTELVESSLVDPDNRRPVDLVDRGARLERLDAGQAPRGLDEEKLLVTSRALRLRRDHPEAFVGTGAGYAPLPTTTGHVVAFTRTDDGGPRVVTLATRLAKELDDLGGWGEHTVALPEGRWHDLLTGRDVDGGAPVRLGELLTALPVALLVRVEDAR